MSVEFLFRLPDENLPFMDKSLNDEQKKFLKTLNLTQDSSADEVRRTATSLRHKFEESGLDAASVSALRWALARTNDVMNDKEFLRFMLEGTPFEIMEDERLTFR